MLKLTKKADYGLIAVKHLAIAGPRGTASAKDIADAYHIPLPLLAKILQKLTKTGLLVSLPGSTGGYKLARRPDKISALEVIHAIDGPIILTTCFTDHGRCDQSETCNVREPLRKVHEAIIHLLSQIKISEMAEDGGARGPEGPKTPFAAEPLEPLHVL
ncbi:MAG TPA: Rrf2 family transcriptional regulator [Bryobacteraceae bacterium]|nr:Rrf2 family transcriptional regulator [Bryobacteraceae bacterium]